MRNVPRPGRIARSCPANRRGQLAAVVIQLGLAAFGASVAVDACAQGARRQWLDENGHALVAV